MEEHLVTIKSIESIARNVLKIVTGKPDGYFFNPGQATEIAINKNGWITETRPFTFTSIPENDY